MTYSENDLPIQLKHGETLSFSDGTTVRFESNGEAKDIMINDSFAPAITLFPANDYEFQACGKKYKCTAKFEDALDIAEA